ncbi:sugar ABC transporter ATP-binding protein [Pararhizobium sp. DWP3-4]|uniref:sugar ABC transporter ATP-binding protein n=1 Tax=Pararhizobium sp. DWP3-4 TaxID=2804565 RepID=UPI003CED546B
MTLSTNETIADSVPSAANVSPFALEMRDVQKSYGAVKVLHGVDFRVKKGSIHALLGANGAGKSTLLKIAVGAVLASDGKILIDGAEHVFSGALDARKAGIGMVFQERSLIPDLTVADNIFLNGERRRFGLVDQSAQHREIRRIFEKLGVQISPNAIAGELGIADQQMVEIAKAVRLAGSVLILDEPTAALTDKEVQRLFAVVRQLAGTGVGVIHVTHRLTEIFDICDDVTIIRDGRTILSKSVQATTMSEVVEAIAGGVVRENLRSAQRPKCTVDQVPMLSVKDLTVGEKLNKVSFELQPGEIVGIAGLAGSGRTTLLKALFGLVNPDLADIRILDRRVKLSSPSRAIREGIYLIPEDRKTQGLVLSHSVGSNIAMSVWKRLCRGPLLSANRINGVVREAIVKFQVNPSDPNKIVEWLSGGNQQKVVLGKAFNARGRVLLLDEPTFGVDIHSRAEITSRIREFVDAGNSVLWATSDLRELCDVSDRIMVLAHGTIRNVVTNWPQRTEAEITRLIQQRSAG